jgi:hypothetical protein
VVAGPRLLAEQPLAQGASEPVAVALPAPSALVDQRVVERRVVQDPDLVRRGVRAETPTQAVDGEEAPDQHARRAEALRLALLPLRTPCCHYYGAGGAVARTLEPTGRAFAATQSHWLRLAYGLVIEHWANRDDLGTGLQLGWFAAPGS